MTYDLVVPSGHTVSFVEPTIKDLLAAQKNGDNIEILRRCLRRINGDKIGYEDLVGDGISHKLRAKDILVMLEIIGDMTTPSEAEMGNAKASLTANG